MKVALRWIGVVVIPIPAYALFSVIAFYLAKIVSFLTPFDSPNYLGTAAVAAASTVALSAEIAPAHQKTVAVIWSAAFIIALVSTLTAEWDDVSKFYVSMSIAGVVGFVLGAIWTVKYN